MTTYNCSLDFGVLEIEGIEAENGAEAREIAMKTFRPVIESIDEKSVRIAIRDRKTRPIITTNVSGFDLKRKETRKALFREQERLCKLVARNAEMEAGIR